MNSTPKLAELRNYLVHAGWSQVDEDLRTTLWKPKAAELEESLGIVLPISQESTDYESRILQALQVIAYSEQRAEAEILKDIDTGGADGLSIRLTPKLPEGQAPLPLAEAALSAARTLIVGAASALEVKALVLPRRRPHRAEAYLGQVRVSTHPGSFVFDFALPLAHAEIEGSQDDVPMAIPVLIEIKGDPYGRRVTSRLIAVTKRAIRLATDVGNGDRSIDAFAQPGKWTPNATELDALAALGGPTNERYQIRFAQSRLAPNRTDPVILSVTPAEQRTMHDASEFLRTTQPRAGVTLTGLVVRLSSPDLAGGGEVTIMAINDDSGVPRRFSLHLEQPHYGEAVRAHGAGLEVQVRGDLKMAGTRGTVTNLSSFAIIEGLDDEPFWVS
jgi:hypothetical protein